MSDSQILHLFGGKGGAGKTTLSAAWALTLLDRNPGEKVLLVSGTASTALADVLKRKLGHKPVRVVPGKGSGGVFAATLEPAAAMVPFIERYLSALQGEKGSLPVSGVAAAAELRKVYEHATDGLEELVGLLQLAELLESGEYDRIVVDGPNSSQWSRILDQPANLERLIGLIRGVKVNRNGRGTARGRKVLPAAAKAAKVAAVSKGKAGAKAAASKTTAKKSTKAKGAASEGTDEGPLTELLDEVKRFEKLLMDEARTTFHLVMQGEPVGEAQTRAFFALLRQHEIHISRIVVNQIEDGDGSAICGARRGLQAPHVRKMQQLDRTVPVELLGRREGGVRGVDELKALSVEWSSGKETKALAFQASEGPPALVRAPSMPPIAAPPIPPTRLIFFVGPGGVGKSSCASAAAVTLTEKEGPVLLISADPLHSLSDVLLSRVTDSESQVKGTKGLYARELDIPGWYTALRRRLREQGDELLAGSPKGDGAGDRELWRNVLDSAPPGIEDLAAVSVLADVLFQERFKRIVVDAIPAEDAFRLIELPERARGWLSALEAVVAKHRARGGQALLEEIAGLKKRIDRFEEALGTSQEARFIVIAKAEELALPRSERLIDYLKGRKLTVDRLLINRVLPKTTCEVTEARRKAELTVAKALEKKAGVPVTIAPALGRHPAGLRELKSFRTAWYALSAPAKTKAA